MPLEHVIGVRIPASQPTRSLQSLRCAPLGRFRHIAPCTAGPWHLAVLFELHRIGWPRENRQLNARYHAADGVALRVDDSGVTDGMTADRQPTSVVDLVPGPGLSHSRHCEAAPHQPRRREVFRLAQRQSESLDADSGGPLRRRRQAIAADRPPCLERRPSKPADAALGPDAVTGSRATNHGLSPRRNGSAADVPGHCRAVHGTAR